MDGGSDRDGENAEEERFQRKAQPIDAARHGDLAEHVGVDDCAAVKGHAHVQEIERPEKAEQTPAVKVPGWGGVVQGRGLSFNGHEMGLRGSCGKRLIESLWVFPPFHDAAPEKDGARNAAQWAN